MTESVVGDMAYPNQVRIKTLKVLQNYLGFVTIVGEDFYQFSWISQAGKVRYLRSTAITYPGNSGSPVINMFGNVVGILFAGSNLNYINVNCVVPLEYIENELMAYFSQK